MLTRFQYGSSEIILNLPEDCLMYQSEYKSTRETASQLLLESIAHPVGSKSLGELLIPRENGNIVIVVSDITRPIPYSKFLPELIAYLQSNGVKKEEITILVATGMHRASTLKERLSMFGEFVANNYHIIDHQCENEEELQELPGRSWSGSKIRLNKSYINAGFRIVTGLVEPHFMAGFSDSILYL